jgi:DNA-binding transcriptional ArsR family regulator
MAALLIRDARQIRSLASPLRQLLLDTLEAIGPCSIGAVADAIGVPADRLYYHLRALERVGLVRAGRRSKSAGRPGLEYAAAGHASHLRYAPGERANVAAVSAVAAGMTRAALREFRAAFAAAPVVAGPRRNLRAARRVAWFTPADLPAVTRALTALLAVFERTRVASPEARPIALTLVLAPLVRRRRTGAGRARPGGMRR